MKAREAEELFFGKLEKMNCKSIPMGNAYTGDISSLKKLGVTELECSANSNWIAFVLDGYAVEAKVFASGSRFGIGDGRISKLGVGNSKGTSVVEYDRGWGKRPTTEKTKQVLNKILKALDGREWDEK
jgi:hypothetical protein